MTIAIVTLCFEIVMLMMLAPMSFGAKSHFSLAREKFVADVYFFRVKIVHITIAIENYKIVVKINGKSVRRRENNVSVKEIVSKLKRQKLRFEIKSTALIGSNNAMVNAIVSAILCNFAKCYEINNAQKCEIELSVKAKITLIDIIQLILPKKQRLNAKS